MTVGMKPKIGVTCEKEETYHNISKYSTPIGIEIGTVSRDEEDHVAAGGNLRERRRHRSQYIII